MMQALRDLKVARPGKCAACGPTTQPQLPNRQSVCGLSGFFINSKQLHATNTIQAVLKLNSTFFNRSSVTTLT